MNITVKIESEFRLPDHICMSALEVLASHIEGLVQEEIEKDGGKLLISLQQTPVYTRSFGKIGHMIDYLTKLHSACKTEFDKSNNQLHDDNPPFSLKKRNL